MHADGGYRPLASPRRPLAPRTSALARFGIGLVLNQLCGGVVQGALPAVVYPLLKRRLRLEGYQATSAQALLAVAATCKLGFSVVMDRLPLPNRWRRCRVPFIYLGWLLVLLFATVLARIHDSLDKAVASGSNAHADDELPKAGFKTTLLLVGMMLGSVLADAGCEAVMVDIERCDRANSASDVDAGDSGQVAHKAIYTMRFVAEVIGAVLVGVSLNDTTFGGTFPFAASTASLFEAIALVALLALVGTMWRVSEAVGCSEPSSSTIKSCGVVVPISSQKAAVAMVAPPSSPASVIELTGLHSVLQSPSVRQLAIYSFLQKLFLDLQSSPRLAIHSLWLHTDPMLMSLAIAVTSGAYALASLFSHRVLLSDTSSWRGIVTRAVIVGGAISLIVDVATALDIVRDKYFVLLGEQLVMFAGAIAMMVRMVAMVELAEAGRESSTYAIVTAFVSLSEPISAACSNYLSSAFNLFDEDIESDTARVRWQVVALGATLVGLRLLGNIVILPLLHRNEISASQWKAECRVEEGKDDNGTAKHRLTTAVVVIVITVSVAALSANVLAVWNSTACLPLVGGAGCY